MTERKLTKAIRRWWFRVRRGLTRIDMVLLERIAETGFDTVPILIKDRVDIEMIVGYRRLLHLGYVMRAGRDEVSYGYAITNAGRSALTPRPGK